MTPEPSAYGLWSLVLFPALVAVHALLGKREEADAVAEFGAAYEEYRRHVPAFVPRLGDSARWEPER